LRHHLFGEGGGERLAADISAPLLAELPIAPAVSHGGDTGEPIAIAAPQSVVGKAFANLAERIVSEVAPPVDMAGCSARLVKAMDQATE
jgi:ATP-binding protein involved in chromosome partitioning